MSNDYKIPRRGQVECECVISTLNIAKAEALYMELVKNGVRTISESANWSYLVIRKLHD